MADLKTQYKATMKRYSTFSLVLAIVIINIWLLNNGERVLPPDIYTQNTSIIYGIILAVIMGIWFITLYAEKRTHIITELYNISIRDSIVGMVLGTTLVLMVFWVVFGAILGESPRDLGWEGYLALVILHGLIVAPIETITAQKMIVDILGYIPAALFFAGMHAAVYGFSIGTMLFAFTMGYIWSRMIGLKTEKWYYGVFGMGFVIAWHATYNIALTVYSAKMLMILSFAGPWALVILLVVLVAIYIIKKYRVSLRLPICTG
ncbi:MAG: hypothetical protein ACXADO_00695 [Candidatus Thorarchaeota archaeon]|jgi:hypothetical protein